MKTRAWWMGIGLACLVGCQAAVPSTATSKAPVRKPGAGDARSEGGTPSGAVRVVSGPTRRVELLGKVRLLTGLGAGVVSNNSGTLLSDHGGAIISDAGGSVVSNNSGSLIGKAKYALRASDVPLPRAENLLADARIQFLDAAGRLLAQSDGKPIVALTDRQGAFALRTELPRETVVAQVTLFTGGTLQALVARDATGTAELAIDTASTLGAGFVLSRYVAGNQEVADRLPAAEATALQADLERARGLLGARIPTYKADEALAVAEDLRSRDPRLAQRLERIRAILLVGQADLGNGRVATDVALGAPIGVAFDGQGRLLIAELAGGRVRAVGADGRVARWAGGNVLSPALEGPLADLDLVAPTSLTPASDGTLYVPDRLANRVWALKDGKARLVAGSGEALDRTLDVPATQAGLKGPVAVAVGPEGRVWIAEHTKNPDYNSRLLYVDDAGKLQQVPAPDPTRYQGFAGLAATPDGALWLSEPLWRSDLMRLDSILWRRDAQGVWTVVLKNEAFSTSARLLAMVDNSVLLSRDTTGQVVRVTADGAVRLVAGKGTLGYGGDGGPAAEALLNSPAGVVLDGEGALFIADAGSGVVRKVMPPLDGTGMITTVAGSTGVSQQGQALEIAINTPGGMAFDAAGRLLFTEGGGSTLKRLDDGALTVLAGSVRGFGGDGGPAKDARLDVPTGVAFAGGAIYVMELDNNRIRRIDPDGSIRTVVGNGTREGNLGPLAPGTEVPLLRGLACAVAPDGRFYWADNDAARIYRLRADGQAEVIAGEFKKTGFGGDGGPAKLARLTAPTGLAFDAKGDLYVADAGNFRIRRISGLSGDTPVIDTVVGASDWLLRLTQPAPGGPTPAAETLVAGATGLTFDEAGNLYYAEIGPRRMTALLGSAFKLPVDSLAARAPRICRVTGLGGGAPRVEPIAGMGTTVMNDAGTDDALHTPMGLLYKVGQGLYILDTGNNTIRVLPLGR